MPDKTIDERVQKDIAAFSENMVRIKGVELPKNLCDICELAKMYADDANSYMDRGDLVTAFSCISYAHGLLDAVLKIIGSDKYGV